MCAHTDRRSALQHTWMPLSDECQKDNKLMCDAVQLIKRAARIATCYANMFIHSMHACMYHAAASDSLTTQNRTVAVSF